MPRPPRRPRPVRPVCGPQVRLQRGRAPRGRARVYGALCMRTASARCSRRGEARLARCGNLTAVAELHTGETVLDLGSGGGIDVLLSARRVGPSGTAYGLDMTDEMLELARRNQREAGVQNVEFLGGRSRTYPCRMTLLT